MKKFTKNDIIELLIKKATGFFYSEEQTDYETAKKDTKQPTFFDLSPTELGSTVASKSVKTCGYENGLCNLKGLKNLMSKPYFSRSAKIISKNTSKCVSVSLKPGYRRVKIKSTKDKEHEFFKATLQSSRTESRFFGIDNDSHLDGMVAVKRKVTTHYVPPDMVAIKLLLDIVSEKPEGDGVENLNDDELLKLKNKLLKELKNDD